MLHLVHSYVIKFPALMLDTSEAAVARCAWLSQFGVGEVVGVTDAATNLVHEARKLCAERQPAALVWVCGPGSYTGLRIGWCVVRTINFVWRCPVWSIKKTAATPEILELSVSDLLDYNPIGPMYDDLPTV